MSKSRDYQDYEEISGLLHLAREALMAAQMKASGKFYATQQDRIWRTTGKVDELRSMVDEQYHKDGLHRSAPVGSPISPMYLGNYPDLHASVVEAASEEVRRRVHERQEDPA